MKTLLTLLLILVTCAAIAQTDSAKLKPSVTIQARDMHYILNYTGYENQYATMDSVMISKTVGSGAVTGTTNVLLDGIQARHWLSMFERIRADAVAVDQGVTGRVKTALNAVNHSWLTTRITRSDDVYQAIQQQMRENGRKRARKELDEQ